MFRRLCGTKIATTSGPITNHDNNFEKVITASTDAIRMDPSHGSPEGHKIRTDKVREVVAKLGRHVVILGDLQGSRIHVSTFKEGKVFLNTGDKFLFNANLGKDKGDKEKTGINYEGLSVNVVPGDILLLDDSRVQLKMLEVQGMKMFTEVTVGGPLSNSEGINKLGSGLSAETPTEKNKADIKTAALIGVDYLAVSFPRYGEDLSYTRRLAHDAGCGTKIIAKVERAGAVCSQKTMDDIILASSAVMVTHGDPGVEIDDPGLVGIQKVLICRARQLNRVVITAIRMMESMTTSPMPAHAEVMDVANTILNGIDAVTLLTEVAAGQCSSETVAAMARACLGAEKVLSINVPKHRLDVQPDSVEEAITMSAMYAASHLKGATAIIIMTESGRTALVTFRIGSGPPIFAMSRHECTLNLTALYRGVAPVHFDNASDDVTAANRVVDLLRDKGYLMSGDLVVVTQGDVMSIVGSTNITHILTVE